MSTDSQTNVNIEDGDNGAVIDDTRQMHMPELQETFSKIANPVSEKRDVRDIEEAIDQRRGPSEDKMTQQENTDKCCLKCFRKKRVATVKSFKRSQHITLPGNRSTFNLFSCKKLASLYKHHAIVKVVRGTCGHKAELTLIHFTEVKEKLGIYETQETLDLEKDEVYIIEHLRPRYSPDDIIRRAKSALRNGSAQSSTKEEFAKYNLFTNNCEHFAYWCVVGQKKCFQVRRLPDVIATFLNNCAGVGSKTGRFIARVLFNATDEIAAGFNMEMPIPEMLVGGTSVIYLIYCCVMTKKHTVQNKNGNLCKTCFKREVIALWTTFGTFVTTSGFSYIIGNFCLPLLGPLACPIGIPCLLVIVVLSVCLQYSIEELGKVLMSPYSCDANPVSCVSGISVGDMISFKYFSIPHNAIVTEVRSENNKSTTCSIRCVHYGLKSWNIFGTREVIEEDLQVDLKKRQIKLYDCRHLNRYPPNQVVERVRKRVGERKWSPFSNRSDHLCFWALVREENEESFADAHSDAIGESKSKFKSTLRSGQEEVHRREELLTGQVVKYEKNHEDKDEERSEKTIGIVVLLEDTGDRQFGMQLVVCQDKLSKCKSYNVDLQKDRLFIKKYHPAHCCSMEERVQRARHGCRKEFEYRGEENFIETCILKN